MNNKKRQLITGVFYVQDERYVVLPWMAMKAMLSAHASK